MVIVERKEEMNGVGRKGAWGPFENGHSLIPEYSRYTLHPGLFDNNYDHHVQNRDAYASSPSPPVHARWRTSII